MCIGKPIRLCAVAVAVVVSVARGAELPQYKFEVGQEINYRSEYLDRIDGEEPAADDKAGSIQSIQEWTIWVARTNKDSSHRLIFQVRLLTIHKDADGDEERRTDHRFYAYADVTDHGRVAENPSLANFFNVHDLFPRLPATAESMQRSWLAESIHRGQSMRSEFRVRETESPRPSELAFEEVKTNDIDPIHLVKRQNSYGFDVKRGFVQSVTAKTSYGWGGAGKYARTYALTSIGKAESDWIGKLDRDIEDCFAPFAATFEAAAAAMDCDVRSTEAELSKIERAAKSARARVETAQLREFFDKELEGGREYSKYRRAEAAQFETILDKPAPAWELEDLDGKTHKLSNYRGKVVVLDFWSRRCAPCIPVMRTLAELSKHFDDESVAILGMNDDENEADARFVHQYLKIPYPTLRAAAVLEDYHVSSWPAIYGIDARGNLRHVRFGIPATLRDDLTAQVRALHKEAGQRNSEND
jgi:thiol-disulfide isomerase/thioredoxin